MKVLRFSGQVGFGVEYTSASNKCNSKKVKKQHKLPLCEVVP